jgi:hypothetical protein
VPIRTAYVPSGWRLRPHVRGHEFSFDTRHNHQRLVFFREALPLTSYSWGQNLRSGSGGDCGASAWLKRQDKGTVRTYTDGWKWTGATSSVGASTGYPYSHGREFLNVLSKGYVTREDYEETYRLYVQKITAAGFVVEKIVDDGGYYLRNYSSRRVNELFARNAPASEMSRLEEEERSLSQECEVGTFQLIDTIFREQSEPSSQFDE